MATTDFKLRYHGSYLGYVWTLLKPLLLFAVLYVVFSVFINVQIEHYQLFLLLGVLLWNYFSESTMLGLESLTSKMGIIKKVAFPRILVVIASTMSSFIGLLCNLVVYTIFSWVAGVWYTWESLFFIAIIGILYMLVLGISLLLSSLYVFLKDMNQVWDVLLQAGFWATPIVYALSIVPEKYHTILFLNPMTGIIQYSRQSLVYGELPSLQGIAYLIGVTLIIFILGYFSFTKLAPYAPERM